MNEAPGAKRSASVAQGSTSSSFIDSEMRLPSPASFVTLTVTSWPTVRTSFGCATRRREISVTWTSPSTPPRSTNAPKSVSDRTRPVMTAPSSIFARVSAALASLSSLRRATRETTTRRPSSEYSITRKSKFLPTNSARPASSWRPRSICETGQNARRPCAPPMRTSKPPLLRDETLPATGIFASAAALSSAFVRWPIASFRLIRTSGAALITTASMRSPTFSPSSSLRSMIASDFPPMETRTTSGVIPAIVPFTTWPSTSFLRGRASSAAMAASKVLRSAVSVPSA